MPSSRGSMPRFSPAAAWWRNAGERGTWSASFEIDPETRRRLLNGLDDIGVTLLQAGAIDRYEAEREREGPVTTNLA